MAQIVLGAAGAVAGGFIGGPTGAQIGWAIGSAIGGSLRKPPTQKSFQSLQDLKVVGTDYGQCIPYAKGRALIAGQVWWNGNKVPVPHTTVSGGGSKGTGGGQPAQESTTYTYKIDLLIGLTCHQIVGILRIFDNGGLIWSSDAGASAGTIVASESAPQWERMTIYTGAADQMPDPDYEAAVGAGLAPAYRDRGSVFVKGLDLGESGVMRNLTFEVVVDGTSGPLITYYDDLITTTATSNASIGFDSARTQMWMDDSTTSPDRIGIYDFNTETTDFISMPARPGGGFYQITADDNRPLTLYPLLDLALVATRKADDNFNTLAFRISTREFLGDYDSVILDTYAEAFVADPNNQRIAIESSGGLGIWTLADGMPGVLIDSVPGPGVYGNGVVDNNGQFWFNLGAANGWRRVAVDSGVASATTFLPDAGGIATDNYTYCYDPVRDCIFFWAHVLQSGSIYIKKIDCQTGVVTNLTSFAVSDPGEVTGPLYYDSARDRLIAVNSPSASGAGHVLIIDPDSGLTDESITIPDLGGNRFVGGGDYLPGIVWGPALEGFGEVRFNTVTATCPTVQSVVSALCLRAGLNAGQIDVTALSSITREVCSFAISQIVPTRQALEVLMAVYFFEAMVDSKLRFVPRGGAPVVTIPYEHLGASKSGTPSEPFDPRDASEIEIPAMKVLSYINLANDYQPGAEESDRLVSSVSETIEDVEYPMVALPPAEAKGVINTNLWDQVASRMSGKISLLGDYCYLQPTDIVMVTGPDDSLFRLRLVQSKDSYPVLDFDYVFDDPNVLQDQGITSTDYDSQTSLSLASPTLLTLLDIPIMRDVDDDAGFYVAARGTATPWPGASVYESNDGTLGSFTEALSITESATTGTTGLSRLGNWHGPRVVDEESYVDVTVNGILTSSTRAGVLADASVNALMIGSEEVQFITATLLSSTDYTRTYRLSRFLRGGRGTEWAMLSHTVAERVVVLQATGLRRFSMSAVNVGVARYYKGVTFGGSVNAAPLSVFTNQAIGKKPFAPAYGRVERDGSNNATITFDDRSRLAVRMVGASGVSVPPDETTAAYEVDIVSQGSPQTVLRTISGLSTPSASYSAGQQTADGLTPGDRFTFKAYKISPVVGRGYELEVTA